MLEVIAVILFVLLIPTTAFVFTLMYHSVKRYLEFSKEYDKELKKKK